MTLLGYSCKIGNMGHPRTSKIANLMKLVNFASFSSQGNIFELKNVKWNHTSYLSRAAPTPSLNDKIDSGKSHLQDLARWWRTSKGVDIPKISQFY